MAEGEARKEVHPTSDKTWRNADYDLSKVPLEAARVFYRTRLELTSEDADRQPWQAATSVLHGWIYAKEQRRSHNGEASLLASLPGADQLATSPFANGGLNENYPNSYLRVESAFDEDGAYPKYWSLEYVERDSNHGYRFWVTEVGVANADEGRCVMNARVRYFDDPTYIYQVEVPERNAPRFIRDLISKRGLVVTCGGVPLKAATMVLTKENFDDFLGLLIDPDRVAPLVVLSRGEVEGGEAIYPVDPRKLSRTLAGVANIYALDRSDSALEESYRYVFGNPDKPAYKYRLEPGCLRIFWGDLDLDEPSKYDYARHRFFTTEALEAFGPDVIVQNISAGVSRMFALRPGEVLGLQSVAYQAALLRAQGLSRQRKELAERLHEIEEKRAAATEGERLAGSYSSEPDPRDEQIELLNALLETADAEIEEHKGMQSHMSAGVSEDDYFSLAEEVDRAKQAELEAKEEARKLQQEVNRTSYRARRLELGCNDLARQLRDQQAMSDLFLEVGKELRDPGQAIEVAAKAFASRLVIMDEARESAADFAGEAGEMFAGLAALYHDLWPMRFGEDGSTTIDEDDFKSRTGFELAFSESKQTNRDAKLMKLRERTYKGKARSIVPHIKGGDKKRGHLRIHFFFDEDERKIVVGHCGAHLKTYGTQRM